MIRHPIRNLLVSGLAGLLIAISIALLKAPYPVHADGPAPVLVVVKGDYADLQAVRRQVEQVGGRVEHIFPPDAFIARLTPSQAEQVRSLPQVASLTFDPAPTLSDAQSPLAIWNRVFHGPAIQLQATRPFSDEVLIAPDLPPPGADIPPDEGGLTILALPYGAGYYDTSAYMLGDVVVALVLPESNGSEEDSTQDWTPAEVASVQSTTVAGLDEWAQAEPNANLTFIYVWADAPPAGGVGNTVECDYEAEKHSNFDSFVINSFMARLGYTGYNSLTNIRDYLNDLRTTYDADWAYLVQVRDDERAIENNCGVAGAYFQGPTLTIYDCDLRDGYTVAHETGHIFGAKDEYCPGACISPIDRYGYLETVNANSNGPFSGGPGYFGGKGEGLSSIMNNVNYNINPYSRGQVGWRDADGDGILDVRDTFPDTSLDTLTIGSSLVFEGQATVVPWRSPGNDISLNTIAGVEVRLNNLTWLPATPVDGTFDGPVESFNITLPRLPNGIYHVEARGRNDVGNVERSYGTMTFSFVSSNPVTNAAPFAAFQVTPARAGTAATFTADASASADLEGQPLQARWDWENDGSWDTAWSSTLVATHNYAGPGIKVIALQLKDSLGASVTVTRSVEVVGANTLPLPSFIVSNGDSRFAAIAPDFTFDATDSSDGETTLNNLDFRWDFDGDGAYDTGWAATANQVVNTSFILNDQGQGDGLARSNHWAVTLQVRDGNGAVAETTRHIWANPYDHPPAVTGLFSTNTGDTTSPLPLDFSLTSDADIGETWDALLEYRFDWDSDGNWDTDFAPAGDWSSYRLTQPGVYSVTMQARDRYGATNQASQVLTIIESAPPVLANFSGSPTSGVAPLPVDFTNLSSGDYNTCAWSFGDGGSSNSCGNPSHTYTAAGVYTVTLTVSGPGGSDAETKTNYITITDAESPDTQNVFLPIIIK